LASGALYPGRMSALPPFFPRADAGLPAGESGSVGERWAALTEAAELVAALAGLAPEPSADEAHEFSPRLSQAEPWRREQAERGVADLAAIMEPGIAALLSVSARGADPRPAAKALWREFAAARGAILSLLPPRG
jgi:hypothetical protein